jgi:hypothetical protein
MVSSGSWPTLLEFSSHVAARLAQKAPISEGPSTMSEHIQAADFAAGWVADLLVATDKDQRALARKVRWVGLNGLSIPASDA